jgi:hypothetical protein
MISPAWEIGGEIGRLSRVVHPWSSRERLISMLELQAFSDESATDGAVYCVAGYWAVARAWEPFDAAWREVLGETGLSEFHAEDCQNGHGEFKGREDRPEIRHRFAEILASSLLHPVVACVDSRDWDRHKNEIAHLRPGATGAFYFAFQMFLEAVCEEVAWAAPDERVAFLLDDRPESGKALRLYGWLRDNGDAQFHLTPARLGVGASDKSERHSGLQAADFLAYEARRWAMGPLGLKITQSGPSDVWAKLSSMLENARVLQGDKMDGVVATMRATWGELARARSAQKELLRAERSARGASYRARTRPSALQSPEPEPPGETS